MKKDPKIFEEILNALPYRIFWKDRNSRYMGVNKYFASDAGFEKPADMIGKNDYDCCWTKEESDFFVKIDKEVMAKNEPILNLEEPQQQLDGSTMTLLTSKVPLHDEEGKVVGILGIYADISDRKELELQKDRALHDLKILQETLIYQEKMSSLGEMAGGIAHEINNPLNIISGYAELIKKILQQGGDTGKAVTACNSILSTIDRCTNIIDNLKSFSRNEADVEIEDIELKKVVDLVQSFSKSRIDSLALSFTVNVEAEASVLCKRVSLEQSLLNLLNNAIDATENIAQNQIIIESFTDESSSGLKVKNTGNEIPPSIQEKIFQPFFTTKNIGKGTGLGLSTSKGLIEKSGGELIYKREEGMNAFIIKLPRSVK